MKFGVYDTPNGTTCANCGHLITKDTVLKDNYCSQCGNPLKPEGFSQMMALEKAIQKDLVLQIEEALKQNEITKIISDFKDQLSE